MTIKVLEEIEHIRKRPGMYIGDAESPEHLVTEVLDNALDELVNGNTNRVELHIDDNKQEITVIDYGRGIPIHPVKMPDGSQVDSIVAIATKLFSSAKFDRKHYDISIGQNGVGLVVVNALSKYLEITTKYKNGHRIYKFKNGEFIEHEDIQKQEYSTKVTFKPDMKYFKEWFESSKFLNRLKLVKVHFPNTTLIFNGYEINNIDKDSFIRNLLDLPDNVPLFSVNAKNGKETIEIVFTYDLSDKASLSPVVKGDVNLKIADGTFISTTQSTIINVVEQVKPKHYVMTKQDAVVRLRAFVSILVPEPRFDSQNKTRFVGNVRHLFKKLEPKLIQLFKKEDYLKHALEKINEYRILKTINKTTKKSKKKTSVGNPIRSSKKPGTLYIVEGLSAGGTLTQIRDVKTEAVFPLKGKVINVETSSLDKVLQNKEVKYLMEVLGIDPGKDYSTVFEKVVFLSDADADGFHINVLLLLFFLKLAKKYIKEGKLYVVVPPLFGLRQKNEIEFLTKQEFELLSDKSHVIRYKGLGEMNPEELEKVIRDERFYLKVELPKDESKVLQLIKDVDYKRQVMEVDLDPWDLTLDEHGDLKAVHKETKNDNGELQFVL